MLEESAASSESSESSLPGAIRQGRWTAEVDGDFVVFVIGAQIAPGQDFLEAIEDYSGGMLPMLDYLTEHPDLGLLGYHAPTPLLTIQYWRSFAHLEAFASNTTAPHLQAWRSYQQRTAGTGRSGIFHETFLVNAGCYEAIYDNMPPTGLGAFGRLVTVAESSRARLRVSPSPSPNHEGQP
jgi:hypothetical protein